jgi:hypothetical protein
MLFSSVLTNRYTRIDGQEPLPDIFLNKHTDVVNTFAELRVLTIKSQVICSLGKDVAFDGKGGTFIRQQYINQIDDDNNVIVETDQSCVYVRQNSLLSVSGQYISGSQWIRSIDTENGIINDGVLILSGSGTDTGPTGPTGLDGLLASRIALSGGNRNLQIYTVSATPMGNGRLILTRCIVRLSTTLVGTGNIVFSVGTTSGGTQIILPVTINSSTVSSVFAGEALASLGAGMLTANAYEAVLNAGQIIWANLTSVGVVTSGYVDVYLYGLPLLL